MAKGQEKNSILMAGKEIAKTMFKEGVLEEMPQSAQEQVFTNIAMGKQWSDGVEEAAAQGAIVGMLQGGGMATGAEILNRAGTAKDENPRIKAITEGINRAAVLENKIKAGTATDKEKTTFTDLKDAIVSQVTILRSESDKEQKTAFEPVRKPLEPTKSAARDILLEGEPETRRKNLTAKDILTEETGGINIQSEEDLTPEAMTAIDKKLEPAGTGAKRTQMDVAGETPEGGVLDLTEFAKEQDAQKNLSKGVGETGKTPSVTEGIKPEDKEALIQNIASGNMTDSFAFEDHYSPSDVSALWDDLYAKSEEIAAKNLPAIDALKQEGAGLKSDRSKEAVVRKKQILEEINNLQSESQVVTHHAETAWMNAQEDMAQKVVAKLKQEGVEADHDKLYDAISELSDGRTNERGWNQPLMQQVVDYMKEEAAAAPPAETKAAGTGGKSATKTAKTEASTAAKPAEPTLSNAPTIDISAEKGQGQATITDKSSLDALGLMAGEIQNTRGNERGTKGEGDTAHNIGSSNPDWFKKLNELVEFENNNGKEVVKYKGISRDTFFAIQKKVKKYGYDSLTEIQKRYYFFIEQVIPDFKAQSGDFKAMDDLAFMEKEGYEPVGGEEIIAGDLNEGDKVLIRGEEFENKGMNPDGTMTLEDGIPIKVDTFDKIRIDGIKKAPLPQEPMETRKLLQAAADKAGVRLDEGYSPDRDTWSVTDIKTPGDETSKQVRTPEDIVAFAEARKGKVEKAEESSANKQPWEITKSEWQKGSLFNEEGPYWAIFHRATMAGSTFEEAQKAVLRAKESETEGIPEEPPFGDNTETLPDGSTVNWNKVETKEKDGLKGTYYATYNKDGSFKKWSTRTDIKRLKELKGTEGLGLKQDTYGKQDGTTKKETKGKQAGLGLVVEDPNQPEMFGKVGVAPKEKIAEAAKIEEIRKSQRILAGKRKLQKEYDKKEETASIENFGEKIGGSRADTAESGYTLTKGTKEKETGPAWRKKYVAMEKVDGTGWTIGRAGDRFGISARSSQKFATQKEAEAAIPLIAVADSHRVYQGRTGEGYSIFKRVGEKKLFKVVNQEFASREEAMKYMAEHAEEILNIKTTFGEEILPVPDNAQRKGVERRTTDATPEMFMETFSPKGIEFGNWNNQEERQLVMNHAYDGLLDLADVLNLPPKALMLNGDLAIAFGARGQGLSGAKAHYEPDYGVINLTKMKGAGSLGHEFFHALDHYLARLDTKASSEKIANERGDMVYNRTTNKMDFQSHGASYKTKLRPELKTAYDALMDSMYKKAEQYVEDTKQADKFIAVARENLKTTLDGIRSNLTQDMTNYHKSKGGHSSKSIKYFEPASAEQLAEFDRLANILMEGGDLETSFRYNQEQKEGEGVNLKGLNRIQRGKLMAGRHSNDILDSINTILKAVRNRQGFNKEGHGHLDRVRAAMSTYAARLKMFEDAQAGTEKTRKAPTSYAIEAKKMDQARSSDYWSEPHEMVARAFAAYVEDKIAENGGQSDFLVYRAHGGILLPMIDGFVARPYPEGAERIAINKEFDKFIGELKTRETDKGIALFSFTPSEGQITPETIKNHPRFKDATVTELKDGGVSVRFQNGKGFTIDLVTNKADKGIEIETRFGRIPKVITDRAFAGVYLNEQKAIILNTDKAGIPTIDHENLHFLEASGFLNLEDIAALNTGAKKAGFNADVEGRADYVAQAFKTRDSQKGFIQKVLQKIQDFFDFFINTIGKRTARGVIRDIESGKIMKAEGVQSGGMAPAYSLTERLKPFFSQLEKAVASKMGGKMPVDQLKKMLKAQNVTDAEIENLIGGLEGTVTKQQVIEEIKANTAEFEDVTLGEPSFDVSAWWNDEGGANESTPFSELTLAEQRQAAQRYQDEVGDFEENAAPFSQYQEPGAEPGSYREMFVTVPNKASQRWQVINAGKGYKLTLDGTITNMAEWASKDEAQKVADSHNEVYGRDNNWNDGHSQYSEIKNPIVRIRFNEREVPAGDVNIKEVGKRLSEYMGTAEKNLGSGAPLRAVMNEVITPLEAALYARSRGFTNFMEYDESPTKRILFIEEMQGPNPANQAKMPEWLRKRIYDIGVKRVLAYAKENGFGGVSFTTGEMQAGRYDLSKHIDHLDWVDMPNGVNIKAVSKDGGTIIDDRKTIDELPDIIGKDLSQRIQNDLDKGIPSRTYSGLDLKVGGEGLKRLYDVTIPALFKKYGKEGIGKIDIGTSFAGIKRTINGDFYIQGIDGNYYTGNKNYLWTPEIEDAQIFDTIDYAKNLIGKTEDENMPKGTDIVSVPFIPITDKTPASYPQYSMADKLKQATQRRTDLTDDSLNKNKFTLEEATENGAKPGLSVPITDRGRMEEVAATISREMGREIAPENLRLWERTSMDDLGKLGRVFQKKVVVFQVKGEDLRSLSGYFVPADSKAIYLNAETTDPHLTILGHELLHALRHDVPDIYNGFVSHLQQTEYFDEFKRKLEESYGKDFTGDAAMEEYAASYVGAQFIEPRFWEDLINRKPGIFKKVRTALIDLLAKLKGMVFRTNHYYQDFRKAEYAVAKAMADYAERQRSGAISEGAGSSEIKRYTVFGKGDRKSTIGSTSLFPDVNERLKASKGIEYASLKDRTRDVLVTGWEHFARHFQHLDPKSDGAVIDVFRRFQDVPSWSKDETVRRLSEFVGKLSTQAREVFAMNIILPDMLRDIENGTWAADDEGGLSFGYKNREQVQQDYDHFKSIADENPAIKEALDKRNAFMASLTDQLIQHKLLKKESAHNPSAYFHHQVLAYMNYKANPNWGLSSQDVRTHRKGWQIGRKGSRLDYNTEYVESEFEVISQALTQIETVKSLKEIERLADKKPALENKAKAENKKSFYRKLDEQGLLGIDDPLKPFRTKIAIGMGRISALAKKGELQVPMQFDDVVDFVVKQAAEMRDAKKADIDFSPQMHPQMFALLNYLVNHQSDATIPAATIFKAIADRNKYIKDVVGKDWVTYRDLVEDGYVIHKPDAKSTFYFANSIADQAIDQVMAGNKLLPDAIKQVLARGRDEEWVVKEGISKTLNEFRPKTTDSIPAKISKGMLTTWKQWILMNPFRVIKYNMNNMSGDLDISMAYDPKIITGYSVQALKDLWAASRGNASETLMNELSKLTKLGVVGSGMTQMDIPELGDVKAVKDLVDFFDGKRKNALTRWYSMNKKLSTLRENILRLAAYRYFAAKVNSGEIVYGASRKTEVDAITNPEEKAAKLARELIGDYGNISLAGQYIRERVIPFYSWAEINAPRYVRLFLNVKHETGSGGYASMGGVVAWKATKLGVKACALMGMVMLWNAAMFPDEEDELQETGREQLHLILGRRADGSIITFRFQGALSDVLSWFGMSNPLEQAKKIASGTKSAGDLAKDVVKAPFLKGFQGIRPDVKVPFEIVSGQSFFPDPLHPRPIRDTAEHIFRTFSLDKIYNRAAGKPKQGGSWESQIIRDVMGLALNESDPGEQAYYTTRKYIFDWLDKQGKEKPTAMPTNQSNSLYYYKQALKFGDFDAAAKYLKRYQDMGGKMGDLQGSIRRVHPLSSLKLSDRYKFKQTLSPEQQQTLGVATTWYKKHYVDNYREQRKQATQ
jgi:hypothetical protein